MAQSWQATAGCSNQFWNTCNEIHHTAYWNWTGASPLLYLWGWQEPLNADSFNGSTAGTGILWAAMSTQDASQGPVPGYVAGF